ncbi:hypothetical protein CTZ27_30370 [Streptomyces griseocarneus]|nr:hypothetical protein CTZ27_30370 [Streptomyces griseocarneus]
MSTPLPELPVTFRPTVTRAVLLSLGTALFAVIVAGAWLTHGFSAGDRATFTGAGIVVFAVIWMLARPRIVATEDGVTVVNLVTTRRLAWAQIIRVNLRAGDPWVRLDLSDGTTLPAMGIQPGIAKDRAVADARALRALAEAHGTARSATD